MNQNSANKNSYILDFQNKVLNWYDSNQRSLQWRDSRNPYHIWISEIMLQQTRVETVLPYYFRFIKQLPDIKSLASASEDMLYKLWEGLGYYSRVRNLKFAANQIMNEHNGEIPEDRKTLETLKGIGPYTSGAISSIAFGNRNAAVDGNVLRVFARFLTIKESIKDVSVKKDIKGKVEQLLPVDRVGDFNQALMEIGATVCVPNGQPKCEICPLNKMCKAYEQGIENEIPIKVKAKKVPIRKKTVLVIKWNNLYAIEKRPDEGLLRSMYQFPLLEGHMSASEIKHSIFKDILSIKKLRNSVHKFSHLKWDMVAYEITVKEKMKEYIFVSDEEIENNYSIPSAFKAYKEYIGV